MLPTIMEVMEENPENPEVMWIFELKKFRQVLLRLPK